MKSAKKENAWQEQSRWLRVGVLSLSTLGPLVSVIVNRLRAQLEAEKALDQAIYEDEQAQTELDKDAIRADLAERLQSIGANLAEVLSDMRTHSYSEALMKRGEDLKGRSSQLSQYVLEQRDKLLGQDLASRGSQLSADLSRRSRRARHELVAQQRSFWIAFGFGTGLTAAAIITYVLMRRRLSQRIIEEEELPIQLTYDEQRIETMSAPLSPEERGKPYAVNQVASPTDSEAASASVYAMNGTADGTTAHSTESVPADAAFVGVTSTHYYYPIETSLDELSETNSKPVDVIFFSSEQEAKRQGFTRAEV